MDGRRERGPEEDGCHKLEDTCTQKRRLEDGREGGQGPTRTVEPWNVVCVLYCVVRPKSRYRRVQNHL